MNVVYNEDCMIGMARYPDKYFDLAIVDPPYGLGNRLSDGGGKLKDTPMATLYRESTQWDVKPDENYFIELFRVSKNQIIWGGNYFELPPSRCMICWNKLQAMPTLSAWELGWTSFDKPSKIFSHVSTDNNRFHPTQKPISLYDWLIQHYAKNCKTILDTHVGSGSSRIAAAKAGIDFVGFEIDADYWAAQQNRFNEFSKQVVLFEPASEICTEGVSLFDENDQICGSD